MNSIKNQMKRAILVSVMMLSMMVLAKNGNIGLFSSITVSAAELTQNGWNYTVAEGKATITGYTGSSQNIVTPTTLGNYPVVKIDQIVVSNTPAYTNGLNSVTISEGVTSLGTWSLSNIKGMTTVKLPSSLTYIGNYAFADNESLTSISIPSSVDTIGGAAFRQCYNLTQVTISGGVTLEGNAFCYCTKLSSVTIAGSAVLSRNAFAHCSSLTTVRINGKATVKTDAFLDCTSLQKLYVTTSSTFDATACVGCTKLQYINGYQVVTLVSKGNGIYEPKINETIKSFVLNSGIVLSENVGFMNTYMTWEPKYVVSQVVTSQMTTMEKVKALHDWVCNKVDYDYDNIGAKKNHIDASIFLYDKSVCEGYSRGYALLLQAAGIEAYYVASGTHAWNVVKVGNLYFHVDTTWDDQGEKPIRYTYFLISDSEMKAFGGDHASWSLRKPSSLYNYVQTTLPQCTYKMGDVNMDGTVNQSDVDLLRKYISKSVTLSSDALVLADCSFDGNVDLTDLSKLSLKI